MIVISLPHNNSGYRTSDYCKQHPRQVTHTACLIRRRQTSTKESSCLGSSPLAGEVERNERRILHTCAGASDWPRIVSLRCDCGGVFAVDLFLPYFKNLSGREPIRRPGLPTHLNGSPYRIRQTELNSPLGFLRSFMLSELEYNAGIRCVRERRASCEYL